MKIDHVAINVKNIKKSIEWYLENLEGKILYEDHTWAMLSCAGTKIALTLESQHPPHIGIEVEQFSEKDNIKNHRDGSSYVYKSDPDGNIIELINYNYHNMPS